jgi:isopenicillin-N N-acyltransferase-like protein
MIEPFPLIEVAGPPRPGITDTITATVAMIVMEPALGVMEVVPLPALHRRFTSYRLEVARPAAAVAG